MNPQLQIWMPTAVIVVGYILGFYFNHRQLESFRREMESLRREMESFRGEFDAKIDSVRAEMQALRAEMRQGFAELRLEFHTQISDLSHRLDRVEERLGLVPRS